MYTFRGYVLKFLVWNLFGSKFSNFKELFSSNKITPSINPTEMDPPLLKKKLMQEEAILKNSKSCRKDRINVELLKYAPE